MFDWLEDENPSPALDALAPRDLEPVMTEGRERERTVLWPFPRRSGRPSRQERVELWERPVERSNDDERFYRTFGAVLLATVLEGLSAERLDRCGDVAGLEAFS